MKSLAAVFPIALALTITIPVPGAGAREPTPIKACQTISKPGSYELANNLTATGNCLVIAADFVTIDLAGFSISGPDPHVAFAGSAISDAQTPRMGTTVRNGSIASGFEIAVDLFESSGSIVEGLRVGINGSGAIFATAIVKGNTVLGGAHGTGISATGTVTGNFVTGGRFGGIVVGQGSTVIGNTVTEAGLWGLQVSCPSNVTDNTAFNNQSNLLLNGDGCNNTNNVAP